MNLTDFFKYFVFNGNLYYYDYFTYSFRMFRISHLLYLTAYVFRRPAMYTRWYSKKQKIKNKSKLYVFFYNFIMFDYYRVDEITKVYKQKQGKWAFLFVTKKFSFKKNNFISNHKNSIKTLLTLFLFNTKSVIIAFILSFIYYFISLFYIQIDFTKQIATWYLFGIAYYLLMSTFNSFLSKYKYSKFTSAIQRFWKRTGAIFWMLEGFLFIIFFYYFLNSSQEPLYMFDYSNLNQELLIQLKLSYKNLILLSLSIFLSFWLILNINFLVYYQSLLILTVISLIIFYMLYVESYQFIYILNIFADKDWMFDDGKQLWILESEQSNLRVKQQYFILCLIAKYWHFIFIFISWFFFLIKSLEMNKISITLLGYNVQNLVILYILNLMCLIQWFKWIFKKFLEITYYWFYIQYDEKFFLSFILELWYTLTNIVSFNQFFVNFENSIILAKNVLFTNELHIWKFIV